VAIAGDFSGIQNFVLKPVPGAGGAARRLRGRSLRVVALTERIAAWVLEQWRDAEAALFYSAGGRFLLHGRPVSGWGERLAAVQAELDGRLWQEFSGEVVFHLAGAEITDGRIPAEELHANLLARRARPLAHALIGPNGWQETRFWQQAGPGWFRCPGCLRTAREGVRIEEEEICRECARDRELGVRLAKLGRPALAPSAARELRLEASLAEEESKGIGAQPLEVVHWTPRSRHGEPLDFEELAKRSRGGRHWLGYLRIDADHIGEQFRALGGDPTRTWALSRLLHGFFWQHVQETIRRDFLWIYPVYGGGDDLFVIGPWDQALNFAARLAADFSEATGNGLTFSAGLALSKPREHILTKSDEAEHLLRQLKEEGPRASIAALGCRIPWGDFGGLLETARTLTAWHEEGRLPSAFLQNVLELSIRGRGSGRPAGRHRPLLYYQIERNLRGGRFEEARRWARRLLRRDSRDWPWIAFLARYVLLASRSAGREGPSHA
jgi:CRISPR-associated protein Csm1